MSSEYQLVIHNPEAERLYSTKFLAIHPTDVLTSRENDAAVVKKAQQHLYVLRRWKTVEAIPFESILTYCISSWFA